MMGQHNYSAIAPPHSVINAMDFPEPKDLANHLRDELFSVWNILFLFLFFHLNDTSVRKVVWRASQNNLSSKAVPDKVCNFKEIVEKTSTDVSVGIKNFFI